MNITVKAGGFSQEQSDVIAIGVLENPDFYSAPLQNIEQALGGRIRELISLGDFTGKHKTTSWLYTNGAISSPRVLLVGLGEYHDLTVEKVRQAAGPRCTDDPRHGREDGNNSYSHRSHA